MTDASSQKSSCVSAMNYCFWAKLLIAIPVLPLIAVMAARLFSNPVMQVVAAVVAVSAVLYLARKIDKLPMLSGMVIKRK